jgi:hypothetical protein
MDEQQRTPRRENGRTSKQFLMPPGSVGADPIGMLGGAPNEMAHRFIQVVLEVKSANQRKSRRSQTLQHRTTAIQAHSLEIVAAI